MDEYVKSIVKALKMYVTGHTSIRMARLYSVNYQMLRQVRDSYQEAFDGPVSRDHKVADSLIDQIKVAVFALKNGFFDKSTNIVCVFGSDGQTD